jgi:PTS system mannose-specific IID component
MEDQTKRLKVTKGDLKSVWLRNMLTQASWNYERMQNLGYFYAMVPVLNRLYKSKEDRIAAGRRHMEFYNTHPYMTNAILGVNIALEEDRANGADVPDETIQGVKVGMMGPLAGVGDPVFWATMRPVLGAFAASFALQGNIMGPILFFVLWNGIRMGFQWVTQDIGYKQGTAITKDLSGGILQKITTGSSILGMFILGVLVKRWVSLDIKFVVSKGFNPLFYNVNDFGQGNLMVLVDGSNGTYAVANPADAFAYTDSAGNYLHTCIADSTNSMAACQLDPHIHVQDVVTNTAYPMVADKVTTLGDILNQLLPGLAPLALMFLCVFLLRKKINPLYLILGIFAVGIICKYITYLNPSLVIL